MQRAREALEKLGIQVDIQDTVFSCWTFLTEEKRCEFIQFTPGGRKECCGRTIGPRIRGQSDQKHNLSISMGHK